MKSKTQKTALDHLALPKALTGIAEFDEISGGGLPMGRPTLVFGSSGNDRTLFAMEFPVRVITQYNEPAPFAQLGQPTQILYGYHCQGE